MLTTVRLALAQWCVLVAELHPIACADIATSGRFGRPGSQAVAPVVLRLVHVAQYRAGQANAHSVVWMLAFSVNMVVLFCGIVEPAQRCARTRRVFRWYARRSK